MKGNKTHTYEITESLRSSVFVFSTSPRAVLSKEVDRVVGRLATVVGVVAAHLRPEKLPRFSA